MASNTITVTASSSGTPRTVINSGIFSWIIDEPPLFGGESTGPSPVESLLGAIGGCVTAIGQWVANEQGFELKRLDVTVRGDIDGDRFMGKSDTVRAGFSSITITIDAEADWSTEQRDSWFYAVNSRCPVIDNIRCATQISSELN